METELDRALRMSHQAQARAYGCQMTGLLHTFRESVGPELIHLASAIHRHFRRAPQLRAIWEPKILSGEVSLGEVLAAIGG